MSLTAMEDRIPFSRNRADGPAPLSQSVGYSLNVPECYTFFRFPMQCGKMRQIGENVKKQASLLQSACGTRPEFIRCGFGAR
jgi:hypothetical protein